MAINTGDKISTMTFGDYDVEKFASSKLSWHSINEGQKHWMLNMNEMSFMTDYGDYWSELDKDIIIDSGTSFNLMPTKDLQSFTKKLS